MKVVLRSQDGSHRSEHEIPPSEVEAFVELCRNHEIFDGNNDPGVVDIVTQIDLTDGDFEVIAQMETV